MGLNTAVCGAAHVHIPPGKLNWAPTLVRQTRPPEAVTAASPVAVLASLNDFAYNFGHALFDFLFPVFNMLQLMGLYHPNFQLLLGTHQVGPLHACSLLQAMMPASLDVYTGPPSRQGAYHHRRMAAFHVQSQPACESQAHDEPDQNVEQRCRQNACRLPAPI